MKKIEILQKMYTGKQIHAIKYYLEYLRKNQIITAYDIYQNVSHTKAKKFIDACIKNNRKNHFKRIEL